MLFQHQEKIFFKALDEALPQPLTACPCSQDIMEGSPEINI